MQYLRTIQEPGIYNKQSYEAYCRDPLGDKQKFAEFKANYQDISQLMVHTQLRKTSAENYLLGKMDEKARNSVIQEECEDDLSELVNSGMGHY
jgi:hypothetical protein